MNKLTPIDVLKSAQTLPESRVITMLERHGFLRVTQRGKGSHHRLRHPKHNITVRLVVGTSNLAYQKAAAQACLEVLARETAPSDDETPRTVNGNSGAELSRTFNLRDFNLDESATGYRAVHGRHPFLKTGNHNDFTHMLAEIQALQDPAADFDHLSDYFRSLHFQVLPHAQGITLTHNIYPDYSNKVAIDLSQAGDVLDGLRLCIDCCLEYAALCESAFRCYARESATIMENLREPQEQGPVTINGVTFRCIEGHLTNFLGIRVNVSIRVWQADEGAYYIHLDDLKTVSSLIEEKHIDIPHCLRRHEGLIIQDPEADIWVIRGFVSGQEVVVLNPAHTESLPEKTEAIRTLRQAIETECRHRIAQSGTLRSLIPQFAHAGYYWQAWNHRPPGVPFKFIFESTTCLPQMLVPAITLEDRTGQKLLYFSPDSSKRLHALAERISSTKALFPIASGPRLVFVY